MHELSLLFSSWRAALILGFCCIIPALPGSSGATGPEVLIQRTLAGKPVPKWENGFFAGFDFEPQQSPTIFAYDRHGRRLFETQLALDGASRVWLRSAAASADARFAFSGGAESASGSRVYFIAFVDSSGRLTRVNRLERLAARHLCFASDGTLWAAVQPVLEEGHREPEHDVLRVYSRTGEFRFSALPRSSFAASSIDPLRHPHPADDSLSAASQLVANQDGVLFVTTGFKEAIRLSNTGEILSRIRFERPGKDAFLTGLSLSPSGEMYVSTQESLPSGAGLFAFYRWNATGRQWERMFARSSQERGRPLAIAMFEGDHMLIKLEEGRFRSVPAGNGAYRLGVD